MQDKLRAAGKAAAVAAEAAGANEEKQSDLKVEVIAEARQTGSPKCLNDAGRLLRPLAWSQSRPEAPQSSRLDTSQRLRPRLPSLFSEQAASAGMAAAGAAKDPQSLSQKCGSDPVLESTFGSRFRRLRQTQALP